MEGTRQTSDESTGQIQSKTIECVAFFYAEGAKGDDFNLFSRINLGVLCSKMFGKVW